MGHINFDKLVKISKKKEVKEMHEISNPKNTLCEHCLQGKQTRTKFKSKEYSMKKPLEIIQTGLCGPTRTKGLNCEKYFMLLVNDYTRMTPIFFLRKKLEAFEHFNIYKEMVETEMDLKIKCLRSENGGDFKSEEFMDFCGEHGIKRQFSTSRTPQQNGLVERKNRTIEEMVKTMLKYSWLSEAQEVHTIVHNNVDCHTTSNPSRMRYYVMFPHWMFVMFSWASHICGSAMISMSPDLIVSLLLWGVISIG
jgi:hypothetical protein